MALTDSQKTDKLFKALLGKSETNIARQFFEEPYNTAPAINPSQIWADYSLIPTTAPGTSSGVVQLVTALGLTAVPGVTNSFYNVGLVDVIPFNFGDGSYNYGLTDNLGNTIAFGQNDWILDTESGALCFFNSIPANMPPKITFYKYVGNKGVNFATSSFYTNSGNSFGVTASLGTNDNFNLQIKTNNTTAVTIFTNSNVAIGTQSNNGFKLNINGTSYYNGLAIFTASTTGGAIRISDGSQINGYILSTDAQGNGSWTANTGGNTASFFVRDGNSFGSTASLGTTDNFNLSLKANNFAGLIIGTSGIIQVTNKVIIHNAASASRNIASLEIGGGIWSATQSGGFTGSSFGTSIAVNEILGFSGSLIDTQINGSPLFRVGGSIGTVYIPTTAIATQAYGVLSIGNGGWAGGGGANFIGAAGGTILAMNPNSSFSGDFIQCNLGGAAGQSNIFRVSSGGLVGFGNAGWSFNANSTWSGPNVSGSAAGVITAIGYSIASNVNITNTNIKILTAASASAAIGTVQIGGGTWSGAAGTFTGSVSGTSLAMNEKLTFVGDFINAQVSGVSAFRVGYNGQINNAIAGITSIITAPLTAIGNTGSMTFNNGLLTAFVQST